MARIVITTWGSFGDVNPYLGLARALRERGHTCVMAMAPFYRPVVTQAGFAFHAVEPDADPALDPQMVARAMHPRIGAEVIFREILMPALQDSHAALLQAVQGADLLVSHQATLAAPLVAEQTGMRWISTVLSPISLMSAHDPVIPPQAAWLRHVPYSVLRAFAPLMARAGRAVSARWVEPVQQLRAALGLPRGGHPIFEGQHAPRGVLAMFSPLLARAQHDWPAHTTITGQLRDDRAHGAMLDVALAQFLDEGAAPVVFTLGSSAVEVAGSFFSESVRAAQQLGMRAVLLVGPSRAAAMREQLPASVMAVDAAPHSLLFPRAAVVVQQCGIGTVGTALNSGRPILSVPYANDQPDNAYRLERLGVSRTVYPQRYTGARAAQAIETLLARPAYAARAREVATVVQAERGAEVACDVIERALDGR
jgi:UDP:flavonoid glycosyltransferase YjiC (YdhE family)